MVKSQYQKMVSPVVGQMIKKLRKDDPNLSVAQAMKKAWKTKEVLDAKKKYYVWKEKQPIGKRPGAKKAPAKRTTTKRKAPAKRTTTRRKAPAKRKPVRRRRVRRV